MTDYIHKRFLVLLILLVLIVISIESIGQAIAAVSEPKTLDRNLEPVVVKGADVASLIGTPVQHLFVYTYTGVAWGGQIPFQVDEVTASGSYTTVEDGLLDANDEIVFMAMDLGDRAPSTEPLMATLPISATWYEIEVSDPTDPAKKGWAYLVRSSDLSATFTDDYVDYTTATQHVTTSQYELGFSTTHFGLNYLALNGSGVDILDRSKLRINLIAPIIGPITVTEDDLGAPPALVPVKDGPVRLILYQTVSSDNIDASLRTTTLAYASLLQTTFGVDMDIPDFIDISDIRTSVDFDSGVSPATFYNANTPAGVTIDGNPDVVAQTPVSKWSQVSHTSGRFIQVTDPTPAGGIQTNFYRDNSTPESASTGQPGSYGETGFLFEGTVNQIFTLKSSMFFLPTGDNVGATYETYFSNPLTVVTTNLQPLLSITKTVLLTNNPAQPDDPITYTIVVANGGSMDATGVRITDTLPTYVNGDDLDETVTVAADDSVTFTINATMAADAPLGETIANTAYYSHSSGAGQDSAAFTMATPPMLSITKTVTLANDPAQPDDPLLYTIVVANSGGTDATGVRITDTLPTYVNGDDLDETVTIAAGNSVTFTINAIVTADAPFAETITNIAYYAYSSNTGQDSVAFTIQPPSQFPDSLIFLPLILKSN